MTAPRYQVAFHDSKYFIKLSGELRYTDCISFNQFLKKICREDDYRDIMVDVSEAEFLDSTNLGLIAKLAIHVQGKFKHKLVVLSSNPVVTKSMTSMGLSHLCDFLEYADDDSARLAVDEVEQATDPDMAAVMLEAHRTLMGLSQENETLFKSVVTLLEESAEGRTTSEG